MRKQLGISSLKLILIIALGIVMAGFISCTAGNVVTLAIIKGVIDAIEDTKSTVNTGQNNTIQVNSNSRKQVPIFVRPPPADSNYQSNRQLDNPLHRELNVIINDMGAGMIKGNKEVTRQAQFRTEASSNFEGTVTMNGVTCLYRKENGKLVKDCN